MALPPLVEPGPELSVERTARYARTTQLPGFGPVSQRRLRAARVLVVGAGGLGSAVLPLLASAGVGTIGIVDDDRVEPSNLPRQAIHTPAAVGRAKVESAADAVRALDDEVELRLYAERLTSQNAPGILAGFDLVLDGSDNFPTRYLVDDAATLAGIPVVWGAVHQTGGQAGLSWAAHGPTYRDLFPVPPAPGTVASCAEAGALPSVCGVIGGLMVSEAIKLVAGTGDPLLGRVVIHDGLRGTFRELAYERDPEAAPVTELIDYDLFCGVTDTMSPAELHARLVAGEPHTLLDVREPWEADIVELPDSLLVPLGVVERDAAGVAERLSDAPLVIVCHHGIRAETARRLLADAGRPGLVLAGGLDAWARDIDPGMPRY
ncbi:adenylyltransferase and sulfurtransferase [Leifsonia sp. 98AMF]|uniref:ThiF family adenylyltransferase n=1 Tax=unclassified Leifsonia TaxID=2663824 RepID=UPI00087C5A5C|nr:MULTISPECIES: ThiF family adenylyltransferase [unclassified Leifsonia]SDH26063.1 adenylyltransferase and sulfurtransferase [Leifsonia sp. 197AMF]SDJ12447.1 adenylyltransferase and sulfurtransferase [Leifsonia sp. 466MF]SDJ56841.1 adenylyltransferase and sulfurtransferase [Leifsonia sp. 157MF]SDN33931.1 adenylyltransferase and sulfurtransferase [Leifsonia sp. 509MF]SEM87734.1 adenylyltransferase and sulfurtransferase [Leifsonia sp. 467MF]